MSTKIKTGCSSFNELSWKGVFYPEALPLKNWFEFYCQQFNTYELNATFYKFPTARTLTNWYNKVPEDFLFSVKMYKGVTHFRKFNNCESEIAEFYAVCRENLKEKLAHVLFQMPPSFSYSDERLLSVVNALYPSFKNVVEFRNASWWREEVFAIFKERNIIFCNVSYPNLPEDLVATAQNGYLRLHGVPKLFYSGYGTQHLADFKEQIQRQNWNEAFVYFNNTASENGILDALAFKDLR